MLLPGDIPLRRFLLDAFQHPDSTSLRLDSRVFVGHAVSGLRNAVDEVERVASPDLEGVGWSPDFEFVPFVHGEISELGERALQQVSSVAVGCPCFLYVESSAAPGTAQLLIQFL